MHNIVRPRTLRGWLAGKQHLECPYHVVVVIIIILVVVIIAVITWVDRRGRALDENLLAAGFATVQDVYSTV